MIDGLTSRLLSYVPMDRRQALSRGRTLPAFSRGAALFADISGFSTLADTLIRTLGPHLGAEELITALNRVYEELVNQVDRYAGSVVGFAGDGLTIWFDENPTAGSNGMAPGQDDREHAGAAAATLRAVTCAVAMQNAMSSLRELPIGRGRTASIGLKAAVAAGASRRFVAGDPAIQLIEIVAGPAISRLGAAASIARDKDILLDSTAALLIGSLAVLGESRLDPDGENEFVPLERLLTPAEPTSWPRLPDRSLVPEQVRPWVLSAIAERVENDSDGFLTDLRFTASLFLRFADLDFEADPRAEATLNAFVVWVQHTLQKFEGRLLSVTIGDKGSYLYGTFGAPMAHGDDTLRAVSAALELLSPPAELAFARHPRIGIAAGYSRSGNIGGSTRTYAVMGDAVNLAARLMQAAEEGQLLMSASLATAIQRRCFVKPVEPIQAKGKIEPVPAVAILGHRPSTAASSDKLESASAFYGRKEDLAQMERDLVVTARGQGRCIALVGKAGIGKSRFARQVIHMGSQHGFECLLGEARSAEAKTPYLAWRSILRALFGIHEALSTDDVTPLLEKALGDLDPLLVSRLPLLAVPLGFNLAENTLTRGLDPRSRKESLEDLLIQCLRRRAGKVPLMLVIEDIHWLDSLSLELTVAISRVAASVPVLLMVTYRPGDTENSLLENLPTTREIRLDELSKADATALILERLHLAFGPQVSIAATFVDTVIARAGGNPLYIEELIQYLVNRGISPSDRRALESLELPGSLASLILGRIDLLHPLDQITLKVASVVGREFRADWLIATYPGIGTDEQVHQRLEVLGQLDLTPLSAEQAYRTYVFKHAIIHEVVYQSVAYAMRSELHEQFAGWLEQSGENSSVDLLAHHYGKGRNQGKKREYFEKAGDAAASRYANVAAIQYYEQLLELLDPPAEPSTLVNLAEVLMRTGDWMGAQSRYLRAIELAEEYQHRRLRAYAQLGLGKLQRAQGDNTAAASMLENARSEFIVLGDLAGSFDSSTELGWLNVFRGEADRAKELIQESFRWAENVGDANRLARALHVMGNLVAVAGIIAGGKEDYASAVPWFSQSLEHYRRLGDTFAVAGIVSNLAVAALEMGDLDRGEALAHEGISLFIETGARWSYAFAHIILGVILAEKGDLMRARASVETSLTISRDLAALQQIGDGLIVMAIIASGSGPSEPVDRYVLRLYSAARKLKEQGSDRLFILRKRVEPIIARAAHNLGQARAEVELAAGATMKWYEAVEYALSGDLGAS